MRTLARTLAAAAVTLGAGIAAAQCPQYGCQAQLRPLSSGGYLVEGSAVFPAPSGDGDGQVCQTPGEWFVLKDGAVVQRIPASWQERTYLCCCPTDFYGEFADVLGLTVQAGDTLEVVLGEQRVCSVTIVAPALPHLGSPCEPDPGPPQHEPVPVPRDRRQ